MLALFDSRYPAAVRNATDLAFSKGCELVKSKLPMAVQNGTDLVISQGSSLAKTKIKVPGYIAEGTRVAAMVYNNGPVKQIGREIGKRVAVHLLHKALATPPEQGTSKPTYFSRLSACAMGGVAGWIAGETIGNTLDNYTGNTGFFKYFTGQVVGSIGSTLAEPVARKFQSRFLSRK